MPGVQISKSQEVIVHEGQVEFYLHGCGNASLQLENLQYEKIVMEDRKEDYFKLSFQTCGGIGSKLGFRSPIAGSSINKLMDYMESLTALENPEKEIKSVTLFIATHVTGLRRPKHQKRLAIGEVQEPLPDDGVEDTTEFELACASLQLNDNSPRPTNWNPYCSNSGRPQINLGQFITRNETFTTHTETGAVTGIVNIEGVHHFADVREAGVKLAYGHFLDGRYQEIAEEALSAQTCRVAWIVLGGNVIAGCINVPTKTSKLDQPIKSRDDVVYTTKWESMRKTDSDEPEKCTVFTSSSLSGLPPCDFTVIVIGQNPEYYLRIGAVSFENKGAATWHDCHLERKEGNAGLKRVLTALQTMTSIEPVPVVKRFQPLLLMQNPHKFPITDPTLQFGHTEEKIQAALDAIIASFTWNPEQIQAIRLVRKLRNNYGAVQGVGGYETRWIS